MPSPAPPPGVQQPSTPVAASTGGIEGGLETRGGGAGGGAGRMKIPPLPFTVTDWSTVPETRHPGETGEARSKLLARRYVARLARDAEDRVLEQVLRHQAAERRFR